MQFITHPFQVPVVIHVLHHMVANSHKRWQTVANGCSWLQMVPNVKYVKYVKMSKILKMLNVSKISNICQQFQIYVKNVKNLTENLI